MLNEFLAKVEKPLTMESKLDFSNNAVVGGFDQFMVGHVNRALLAARDGDFASSIESSLQDLHDLWTRYEKADRPTRERIVAESHRLLEVVRPVASTVPAATVSRSTLPAASPKPRPAPAAGANAGACTLQTELTYLKGVGPKRAALLAKLGLHTVYDLLYYFPARYEDRRMAKPIAQLEVGEKESFRARVVYAPQSRVMGGRMGGRQITRVRVGDDSGQIDLQWWNQPYREKQFEIGMELFVYGKVGAFNGLLQVDSPEFEVMGEGDDALQVGRIVPVYPATQGLFQSALRRAVSYALEHCTDLLEEPLPAALLESHDLRPLDWSLRQIHFPDDWEAKEAARGRLVIEELFLLQVALAQKKQAAQVGEMGIRHVVEDEEIKKFVAALPFRLTGAQKRVMNQIRKDLRHPRPMNRMLHGDVGSGKTVVAAYALWTAYATGNQGALMAPTEILAEQHYSVLKRLLGPLGIEVALLEGSLSGGEKRRIQADLTEGRTQIVVGTHALIQDDVIFNRLSVCVVDEQHRFGVMQRAALHQKSVDGTRPDILVMTATPIPRTLALTIYGDLDVSSLDELPPGRQPIKTVKIKPLQRERAYKFVIDEVKKGRQAYVVCPLVEESEKLAHLKAATALAERLRAEELHDLRVGLVHGQMNVVEREAEMELFRAGMRDVLVSTTVIEVGVDVPNATIMLIEDAERFGLSQLHQLRGRVGRGEFKSTCVLLSDPRTDVGKARINVMTKTQDGFEIAEHDLNLRGPGEFYGTRQSGQPDFRLANIITDVDVIQVAREAAIALVAVDPNLTAPENQPLLRALNRFWGDKMDMVRVS